VITFLAFAKITDEVIEQETTNLDSTAQNIIYGWRNPTATKIMEVISFGGSKEFILVISLALIIIFWIKNKREAAIVYTTILLLSLGLNNLIKFAVHRPRPTILPLENFSFYSFPSGHVMNATVFYGLLAYFIFHYTRNKKLGAIGYVGAIIMVIMIGFSRLYLGAHYLTDVLAGLIAGIFILTSAIAIDKTLH